MFNSFRRFFKTTQNRKTRRFSSFPKLELLCLEERITPATFATDAAGLITIQLAAGESLTAISSSITSASTTTIIVTFNYTSSVTNSAFTPASNSGFVQTTNGAAGAASVVTYLHCCK